MNVFAILVVAIAVAIVYRNESRRGLTLSAAVALTIVGCFVRSTVFIFFGLMLIGFVLIASRWGFVKRHRRVALILCSVTLFCFFALPAFKRVRKVWEIRKQTPYVSLVDRLKPNPNAPVIVIDTSDQPDAQQSVASGMVDEFGFRASAIRTIHQTAVHHFLVAEDFGVGRMRYDPLWVAQDHGRLIEMESAGQLNQYAVKVELPGSVKRESDQQAAMPPLSPEVIARFGAAHKTYESWFLNDSRLGDVRDVNSVAGFLSHAMTTPNITRHTQVRQTHAPLEYWDAEACQIRRDFTLRRLQLVGLLYHDKPVVYDLETLPELINSKTAPTRDLTGFEQTALDQLVSGRPIYVQQNGDSLQMMGAIRNVESCRECHEGPENQLLGAFTYDLVVHEPNRVDDVEHQSDGLLAHSD